LDAPHNYFFTIDNKGGSSQPEKGLPQSSLAGFRVTLPSLFFFLLLLLLLLLSHATHLRWQMCLIRVVLLLCRI
jgi:hypothetical protein